jgi:hypothetical protein
MEQIKIVRLKNGEDIIGNVIETDYECYIKDALRIELYDDVRKQTQVLTLANWAPSSIIKVNECKIYENDILTKFEPTESFVQHYQATIVAMQQMVIAKEKTDSMSDEEIVELITAMEEREESGEYLH